MELTGMISGCIDYTRILSTKDNVKKEENFIPRKVKNGEVKFYKLKRLAPPIVAALLALSPISSPQVSSAQTLEIQRGATLFQQSCIGCHDAGGNVIQPGATLFTKDLQRNGVDTEEAIYRVTYYGKGRMPVSNLEYVTFE
ncbi:cytochrome c6, chloroplastic isoform X1 [Arachis ipaensis]|uniref:cytochrome c6, chloroplastic isoform X1 n=1 Tax=Arachis ipaensis TaxID=130454 RepID=UPI000A2B775D|nr:cytochrome c6, chloroplastic isoform X1 [Arachis ipaensis]